jgi:hydroxymethylglutaryl-CoA lyase
VTIADASAGGLGGCPFAPGATGNLATEDLVYACEGSGVRTGVDLEALIDTTEWVHRHLERAPASRVARAAIAKRRAAES